MHVPANSARALEAAQGEYVAPAFLITLTAVLTIAQSSPAVPSMPASNAPPTEATRTFALQLEKKSSYLTPHGSQRGPRWISVPKLWHFQWDDGGLFSDILSRVRAPKWYGDYGTTAHEATHLLNNEISHGVDWAFYVGEGKAMVLPPPKLVMTDVARTFPESVRGPMYAFYIVGIPQNEPVPMVLLDEWIAYDNDVRVQIQLINLLSRDERVRVTEQLAEFCMIGLAVYDAVLLQDPKYLVDHPEFSTFVAWLLERSLATYDAASAYERFKWEEKYMTPPIRRYLDARLKLMNSPAWKAP